VRITREAADAIRAHTLGGYPFEVCGILVGRGAEAWVERAVAVANREEEARRVRYAIAPEDLLRVQREADASGQDVVGFYHSHPDHPARPSETDRRLASEGLSDGVVHVVVAVAGGRESTPAAFVFQDALQAFLPIPFDVVEEETSHGDPSAGAGSAAHPDGGSGGGAGGGDERGGPRGGAAGPTRGLP
jgi:proteasome lid subunit RPN8/RPN11